MVITFRLRPGKDDGLLSWYDSLPKGERSRVVRMVLKDYAGKDITLSDRPETNNKAISDLMSDVFN